MFLLAIIFAVLGLALKQLKRGYYACIIYMLSNLSSRVFQTFIFEFFILEQ